MSRVVITVAVLAAVVFLFAEGPLGPLGPVVKMLPVAACCVLVVAHSGGPGKKLAACGLSIAALADLLIEFSFLAGLVTFLLAHLFYIAAFTAVEPRLRPGRLAPVAVWAALALPILMGGAGSLRVPVLIYGLVIFAMIWRAAAAALNLRGFNPGTMGLAGAILFGVSDTLLGWSRFVAPIPASDFLVLGTYWTAQALIASSFIRPR